MTARLDSVVVRYGRTTALHEVTLRAEAGTVTCAVGGDGAGKTTLLRVLAGALAPTSGTVERPPATTIGYLPAGAGLYDDLTVNENLAFSARAYGLAPASARVGAETLLARTGLAGVGERLAGQLSGGMRQKLGVVRAMLHQPRLLVLDEPTTGVDPVSRADLWWLIARAAASGAAVVLSTTYVEEARRARLVVLLEGGRVLASGSPAAIVDSVPGQVLVSREPPPVEARPRAWRRGRTWHRWVPRADAAEPPSGWAVTAPDLRDAVVVATLAAGTDAVNQVAS